MNAIRTVRLAVESWQRGSLSEAERDERIFNCFEPGNVSAVIETLPEGVRAGFMRWLRDAFGDLRGPNDLVVGCGCTEDRDPDLRAAFMSGRKAERERVLRLLPEIRAVLALDRRG